MNGKCCQFFFDQVWNFPYCLVKQFTPYLPLVDVCWCRTFDAVWHTVNTRIGFWWGKSKRERERERERDRERERERENDRQNSLEQHQNDIFQILFK